MGISKKSNDPSRAERKAKKRKLEDAIPDLPGDGEAFDVSSTKTKTQKDDPPSKKMKRAKDGTGGGHKLISGDNEWDIEQRAQTKKDRVNAQSTVSDEKKGNARGATDGSPGAVETTGSIEPLKKSKKERKAERKARETAKGAASHEDETQKSEPSNSKSEPAVISVITGPVSEEKKPKKNNRNREKKRKAALEGGTEGKAHRFIAFIGNLPYSTTTDSLQKHFASVKPKSIRHSTEKNNPQKSNGFAFVEFEGYDHMKTCLKLFHHSLFDDGVSPARKINVELTAGGGGNTKDRRAKIEGKNQKLNEERVRRNQEEEKAKATKSEMKIDESSVHPSRRARIPAA